MIISILPTSILLPGTNTSSYVSLSLCACGILLDDGERKLPVVIGVCQRPILFVNGYFSLDGHKLLMIYHRLTNALHK
ncbi:unnamed protein product [Absidia cylindrospora]